MVFKQNKIDIFNNYYFEYCSSRMRCTVYSPYDISNTLSRSNECFVNELNDEIYFTQNFKIYKFQCNLKRFKGFFCKENKS